jgi:hypothetical protein
VAPDARASSISALIGSYEWGVSILCPPFR